MRPTNSDTTAGVIAQLRHAPARGRGQKTVERLLGAADAILASDGAAALSTTRVAEAAGVSIGTVYNWFPDKESIAEALALRYWAELVDLVAGVAEAAERERLDDPFAATMGALVAGFRARPGFIAMWFSPLRTEQLRDATRPYRTSVAASLERILATAYPDAPKTRRATVAQTAVLIGDGLLREAFRRDQTGDQTLLTEADHALRAYIDSRMKGHDNGE